MLCDRLKGQLSKNIPMPMRAENYKARSTERYLSWTYGSVKVLWECLGHSYLIQGSHPLLFSNPRPEDMSTRWMTDRKPKQQRPQWTTEQGGWGGVLQKEDLKDKRHFVGVRFVLSNSYSLNSSLPLSFPFLIKQALIWVPSPAAGKEKAACNFERSQLNDKDKSFEHTQKKKEWRGKKGT